MSMSGCRAPIEEVWASRSSLVRYVPCSGGDSGRETSGGDSGREMSGGESGSEMRAGLQQ